MPLISKNDAVHQLKNGSIIAYPTESVFGLGCDPDNKIALRQLLAIKHRDDNKGLILIGDDLSQFLPYIDVENISQHERDVIEQKREHAITWIVPKSASLSPLLSGRFDSIAIRITQHPLIQALCHEFGKPIVSTSANLSGRPPCKTAQETIQQFGDDFIVLNGKTLGAANPSEIRELKTGQIIRHG